MKIIIRHESTVARQVTTTVAATTSATLATATPTATTHAATHAATIAATNAIAFALAAPSGAQPLAETMVHVACAKGNNRHGRKRSSGAITAGESPNSTQTALHCRWSSHARTSTYQPRALRVARQTHVRRDACNARGMDDGTSHAARSASVYRSRLAEVRRWHAISAPATLMAARPPPALACASITGDCASNAEEGT